MKNTELDSLLEFVRDKASDRKLRLFLCACGRRLLPRLKGRWKKLLDLCEGTFSVSERYADRLASRKDMEAAMSVDDLLQFFGPESLAAEVAWRTVYDQLAGDDRPMRRGRNINASAGRCRSGGCGECRHFPGDDRTAVFPG